MIKVGILGMGTMGTTHLDVYAKLEGVEVVAVADLDPGRLSGKTKAQGNIEGQAQGAAGAVKAQHFTEGEELIDQAEVDLVDICVPTPGHRALAEHAIKAGKHLLVEKPLARTAEDARAIAQAAAGTPSIAMPAMCMRFWPGWTWLKQAVTEQTYGPVRAAHFRRLATFPGGPFYANGEACGGAILDFHIHDTDFVQHLFGTPAAVFSRGYRKVTSEPDHVLTQYLYEGEDAPALVAAEGGWAMGKGFGFEMRFTVNFEDATASFHYDGKNNLILAQGGKAERLDLEDKIGYEPEIAYVLDCIRAGRAPQTVTLDQAAESVRLVEAEKRSLDTGRRVEL